MAKVDQPGTACQQAKLIESGDWKAWGSNFFDLMTLIDIKKDIGIVLVTRYASLNARQPLDNAAF